MGIVGDLNELKADLDQQSATADAATTRWLDSARQHLDSALWCIGQITPVVNRAPDQHGVLIPRHTWVAP